MTWSQGSNPACGRVADLHLQFADYPGWVLGYCSNELLDCLKKGPNQIRGKFDVSTFFGSLTGYRAEQLGSCSGRTASYSYTVSAAGPSPWSRWER